MIIQEKPKRAGYFFLKKGTPSPFPEEILGPCGNRPPLFRKTGKKDLPMPSSKTQPAWSQSRPKTRGLHRPQRRKHLRKGSPGTAGSAPGKPVFRFPLPFCNWDVPRRNLRVLPCRMRTSQAFVCTPGRTRVLFSLKTEKTLENQRFPGFWHGLDRWG